MKCKFCEHDKKLIKAHIIPESILLYSSGNEPAQILSSSDEVFPKRSPIGIYDTSILCKECDSAMGVWDDYGKQFLTSVDMGNAVCSEGKRVALKIPNPDCRQLKLFLLSVLWRASVSNEDFFKGVDLGHYEPVLKDVLRNANQTDFGIFKIAVTMFDYDSKLVATLHPHRVKLDGVNYFRLYMLNYVFLIKVDKQKSVAPFDKWELEDNEEIIALLLDYQGSQERDVMANEILSNPRNKNI